MLIEYPEPEERRRRLAELKGIEDRCWVQVDGCERVYAIADEDLERENEEKTSAVHFVRFELDAGHARRTQARRRLVDRHRSCRTTGPARRWRPKCAQSLAGDLA